MLCTRRARQISILETWLCKSKYYYIRRGNENNLTNGDGIKLFAVVESRLMMNFAKCLWRSVHESIRKWTDLLGLGKMSLAPAKNAPIGSKSILRMCPCTDLWILLPKAIGTQSLRNAQCCYHLLEPRPIVCLYSRAHMYKLVFFNYLIKSSSKDVVNANERKLKCFMQLYRFIYPSNN